MAVPRFLREKLTVTVSAGSIAPFTQPSEVSAPPRKVTNGGTMVAIADDELFVRFVSNVLVLTVALLVTVPAETNPPRTMFKVAVPPLVRLPKLLTTKPGWFELLPWLGVAEVKVNSGG